MSDEEIKISEWNEAQLEMMRSHELQKEMNFFKKNFSVWNEHHQMYNYELIFINICSLLQESTKVNKTERDRVHNLKDALEKFMRDKPASPKYNGVGIIDESSTIVLKDKMFQFEDIVRGLREKHGYTTPSVESHGIWD